MNRLFIIFLVTIFAINSYSLDTAPKVKLSKKETQFLKKHPKIVLGSDKSWKPYVIVDKSGNVTGGYDKEVLDLINEATGANFVLKGGIWNDIVNQANDNKIDGLSTCVSHKERKKYFKFSNIYITMEKMFITSKSNKKNIKSLEDIPGKRIAVYKGNLIEKKTALKFKNTKVITYDTIEEVIRSVVIGDTDLMFGNIATLYLANKLGLGYLELAVSLNEKLNLQFGVRKDWGEAVSILNKGLEHIGEQKLLELKNKWFLLKEQHKKTDLTKNELQFLKDKKNITMCIDPDWMPLEGVKNGKHTGMSGDYIKLLDSKLPVPIKLVPTGSWSDSLEYAKTKKCDILPLAMETKERKKYLNFTTPYLLVPLVIATRPNVSFINDFNSLVGKEVGIPKGYAFFEILRKKYPKLKIVEVENVNEGLKKVSNGKLFGYIGTLASVGYHFQQRFTGELKIAGKFDEKWELGIAVDKDQTLLLQILQKTLNSIDEDEHRTILNKWIAVSYNEGINYKLIWQISIVAMTILAIVMYWNIKLANEISKRRKVEHKLQLLNNTLEEKIDKAVIEVQNKEKMLQHQSRLAQMGEMLNMIAHQWRQPLGAISSAVFAAQTKILSNKYDISKEDEREKFIEFINKKYDNINEYVQFLSTTIDDFRNFFKPDKDKEIISLATPVKRSLFIVKNSLESKGVDVITEFKSDPKLYLYQNEMLQVILNILKNSEDAFLENKIKKPKIVITTNKIDDKYILSITDNAGGISEDIIYKIFDPYFSTKQEKNGTGLGLYMSKIIIEEHHNGKLQVNNVDGGVCFSIILKAQKEQNHV